MSETWGFTDHEWVAIGAAAAVLYTVATAVLVFFAGRQLNHLAKQVKSAEDARLDALRPAIIVTSAVCNGLGQTQLQLRNAGPGPAFNVRVDFVIEDVSDELAELREWDRVRPKLQERLAQDAPDYRLPTHDMETLGVRQHLWKRRHQGATAHQYGIARANYRDIHGRELSNDSEFELTQYVGQ